MKAMMKRIVFFPNQIKAKNLLSCNQLRWMHVGFHDKRESSPVRLRGELIGTLHPSNEDMYPLYLYPSDEDNDEKKFFPNQIKAKNLLSCNQLRWMHVGFHDKRESSPVRLRDGIGNQCQIVLFRRGLLVSFPVTATPCHAEHSSSACLDSVSSFL
jgi:hypothetical protein